MSNLAKQTVVHLKDFRAADGGDQVSKALKSFATQVEHSVNDWRAITKSATRYADGLVRSSPWQALGVVALAGVTAGVVMSFISRRTHARSDDMNVAAEKREG